MPRQLDITTGEAFDPIPPLTDVTPGDPGTALAGVWTMNRRYDDPGVPEDIARLMDEKILALAYDFAAKRRMGRLSEHYAKGITLAYITTVLGDEEAFRPYVPLLAKAAYRVRLLMHQGKLKETSSYAPKLMGVGQVGVTSSVPIPRRLSVD